VYWLVVHAEQEIARWRGGTLSIFLKSKELRDFAAQKLHQGFLRIFFSFLCKHAYAAWSKAEQWAFLSGVVWGGVELRMGLPRGKLLVLSVLRSLVILSGAAW